VIVSSLKNFQTALCPGLEVSVLKIQGLDLCVKIKTEPRSLQKIFRERLQLSGKGLKTRSKTITNRAPVVSRTNTMVSRSHDCSKARLNVLSSKNAEA
jgi:hypothetical protein